MIQFTGTKSYNETECYLCREANITVDDEGYNVQYQVIIEMADGECNAPTIIQVEVEGIPDLDDYTFIGGLTEKEEERRVNKRDHIYAEVQKILNSHYKVGTNHA